MAKPKQPPRPTLEILSKTTTFMTVRPDTVPAFMMGISSLLKIFKTQYKEAIEEFLNLVETEFFHVLQHHFSEKFPEQKNLYTYGQTVRNAKGGERFIFGIAVMQDNKKRDTIFYEYLDNTGKQSTCKQAEMEKFQGKI